MSTAAAFLDTLAENPIAGMKRPRDLPLSDLRAEAIRRLLNPKAAGYALVSAWRELREAHPEVEASAIRAHVSDTSLPHLVRARLAEVLLSAADDVWWDLVDELAPDEETLAIEGLLEYELTIFSCGLRTANDVADLLAQVPADELGNTALLLDRARAACGVKASEAYAEIFARPELSAAWPGCAPALAEEGTPEALAALDTALLARPEPAEAAGVRVARERLVTSRPGPARRTPPRGEAYFSRAFGPWHSLMGTIALARGRSRQQFVVELIDGKPVEASYAGTFPEEASRRLLGIAPDPFEVPFGEALALLAQAATEGVIGGSATELAPIRDALRRAPPLPPILPGRAFSEAELHALFDTPLFAEWVAAGKEPQDGDPEEKADVARHLYADEEQRASLARKLDRQIVWVGWHGEPEIARRLAAHRRSESERAFRLFLRVWSRRFVGLPD